MSLFRRKKQTPIQPIPPEVPFKYPSGVCVETESGRYYLKGNRKYKIKSDLVFKSWSFPVVIKSSDVAISKYTNSLRRLGFRDGSILRDIYNGELFIISEGERIKITTVEMYEALGINESKVPYVSHEDVVFHKEGEIT